MNLRCISCNVFLCLVLGLTVKSQVIVQDQGYQNVLISFENNVPSKEGKEIVEKIKDLLESTSSVLNKAIGIRISSATFLLPPSWSTDKWENTTVTPASRQQTGTRPDIRVDATKQNPFGILPVALQHGGCGVPAHQITLPLDFLNYTEGYSKGKLLAREWLKYRYGVFDENGFPDDHYYPDYYRIPPSYNIRIPDCTNSKVTYTFKTPEPDEIEICKMTSEVYDFNYCRAHPDKESATNVTSSLMYFHKELPNMEHICGKDGLPHNSEARNKHNALCGGRSIWEVITSSKDFKTIRHEPVDSVPKSIQFSYVQESRPRFVVLLENSDNLFEKGNAILFALRQFYYYLPAKSKLAIYTFNSDLTNPLPFTELPAKERGDLGVVADFGTPATSICTSCGLTSAAQILLQDSEIEKGSIVLITASPLDKFPELSPNLNKSGVCLHVLRLEDDINPADHSYDPLVSSFHCFSEVSLQMSLDDVDIFQAFSQLLRSHVPEYNDKFVIKTAAFGNMSAQIPMTILKDTTAELYTLWLGRVLENSAIECRAGENNVKLNASTAGTEITSFTFAPVDEDVICRLSSLKQQPLLTAVYMKAQRKQDIDFDVWIEDTSTKEQLPIRIYTKLYFGGYPVKYANVRMLIKSETNQSISEVVKPLDNGHGDPDVTKYDGIYSGYFDNFLIAGRYLISVTIDDNYRKAKIGKEKLSFYHLTYPCCGSEVVSDDHDLEVPTFKREKHMVYEAKNKRPEGGYPPRKIQNLIVWEYVPEKKVYLIWSVPEGAVGYALKMFLDKEDAFSHFDTTGRDLSISEIWPGHTEKEFRILLPIGDLDKDITYYAAVRCWNEFNKSSETSNIVEFIIPKPLEKTSTPETTTGRETNKSDPPSNSKKTVGITLGVLGGIAILCALAFLGYYFFVKKPKRSEKRNPDVKAENKS